MKVQEKGYNSQGLYTVIYDNGFVMWWGSEEQYLEQERVYKEYNESPEVKERMYNLMFGKIPDKFVNK